MRTLRRLPLVVLIVALIVALPASAAAAITGQAYLDYNSNGTKDTGGFTAGSTVKATDIPLAGVVVTAYNASGTAAGSATTDASGTYTLAPSGSGPFRIQFATPSGYQPSFHGTQDGTSVQFAADGASNIDFAVVSIGEYCQDNPQLITCRAPAADEMTSNPTAAGALRLPAAFGASQTFSDFGGVLASDEAALGAGQSTLSALPNLGATFGVGVDRGGNAYFGTYVKRFSPYGPAGAVNAVYRVNIATGATSTFVTLGSATLPAHSAVAPTGFPPYSQDGRRNITNPSDPAYSNVYNQVGRAGLGDVDVSPDGSTLYAVEMTQSAPTFWKVPIIGSGASTTAGTPSSLALTAPTTFGGVTCEGNWHPMGIGVRASRVIVGGVCGGDESRAVDPATGRTEASAWLLELNAAGTGFDAIAAFDLGYAKGGAYQGENLFAWDHKQSGLWHNWYDGPPAYEAPGGQGFMSWGKPMIANIEILDDGGLALAFRDRFYDQIKPFGVIRYEWDGTGATQDTQGSGQGAAEILRLCWNGSGYIRESGGTCGTATGAALAGPLTAGGVSTATRDDSPLFYGAAWVCTLPSATCNSTKAYHPYTSIGGAATMPGVPVLWSTVYDITSYSQQGIRALGPCPARSGDGTCGPAGVANGAMVGGAIIAPTPTGPYTTYDFAKGNGLGDLELLCDAAPVQIGNRVWIDTNKDGVQDPGESAVKGVTVRLYDAGGTLVGTALTDANGQYYFSSNVTKVAAGDGTNVGGGLTAGAAFTVKLDNPADYAAGGPLQPYVLTKADTTSPENAANSKATMVGGYPTIAIPARTAGQNNHTFDVGFHRSGSDELVAVGDYTWVDTNRNGLQDERPLKGVQVVLLTVKGERAKDAAGKVVPMKTTNRKGYYVFDGLNAGSYRVRFILPVGYRFTKQGAANAKRNSNPRATKANPLVGLTPVFEVYAAVKGNTVRNTNAKVNAVYIDPTIDAGVVRYAFVPVPSNVTG